MDTAEPQHNTLLTYYCMSKKTCSFLLEPLYVQEVLSIFIMRIATIIRYKRMDKIFLDTQYEYSIVFLTYCVSKKLWPFFKGKSLYQWRRFLKRKQYHHKLFLNVRIQAFPKYGPGFKTC